MKTKFLPSVALGSICLVVAAVLALINSFTAPKIEQNHLDEINKSLTEVLEGHSDFEDVKRTGDMPKSVQLIKKSKEGGYVFTTVVSGKSDGLTVLVGITPDGKIAGTKCTANNETPSYAEAVFEKTEAGIYKGMSADDFEAYLVSGSTLTSRAYGQAVKDALEAFAILEGGAE